MKWRDMQSTNNHDFDLYIVEIRQIKLEPLRMAMLNAQARIGTLFVIRIRMKRLNDSREYLDRAVQCRLPVCLLLADLCGPGTMD